jgi:beta-galactosidase
MNDFGFPLRPPNHPLLSEHEFSGHMYPTKRGDNIERLASTRTATREFHDALAGDAKYAGGLGWCAFDYNTHDYFGSATGSVTTACRHFPDTETGRRGFIALSAIRQKR